MRSTVARLSRWVAIPALILSLTLPGAIEPVSAQGTDEVSGQQAVPAPATTVANARERSFNFAEYTRIPGVGWIVDAGGPGLRIDYNQGNQ